MIIPIFPLELVQFPGVATPLHIFEPRYRQLLKDIEKTDSTFGIIFSQSFQVPVIGAVGCTVEVFANEKMEDGRSNILCAGNNRFIVKRIVDGEPYLQAEIDFLADVVEFNVDFTLRDKSKGLLLQLMQTAMKLNNEEPSELPPLPDDPVALSFLIAASVAVQLEEKQLWLEMTNTNLRLSRMNNRLKDMIEELNLRFEVQQLTRQKNTDSFDV
jgi:Lon protease-like protein